MNIFYRWFRLFKWNKFIIVNKKVFSFWNNIWNNFWWSWFLKTVSLSCCCTWGGRFKTLSIVFCKFCSLGFNLSPIKIPGVGSIMSLIIFFFYWSADSFAASNSPLLICIDVLIKSSFALFLSIPISSAVNNGRRT